MRVPIYKFYLDSYEIKPHYKELKKKYALENNQRFFRVKVEGEIKLVGPDYLYVKESSLDKMHNFIIKKFNYSTGLYYTYFEAEFNKTDCSFDMDNRTCKISLLEKDMYSDILAAYSTEYDLIKLKPYITKLSAYKGTVLQFYVAGDGSVTNYAYGTTWTESVNQAVDDATELQEKYKFAKVKNLVEITINNEGEYAKYNGVYAGLNNYTDNLESYTNKQYYLRLEYQDNYNSKLYIINKDTDIAECWALNIPVSINKHGGILSQNFELIFNNTYSINPGDPEPAILFTTDYVNVYDIYQRRLLDKLEDSYDIPSDDFANFTIFKRVMPSSNGLISMTTETSEEPTQYGINDYGQYFTDNFGDNSVIKFPIIKNGWVNSSIWFLNNEASKLEEKNAKKEYLLKDSFSIGAIIKALLSKIAPDIQHEETPEYSQFLYDYTNPVYKDSIKYWLFITQKTNILKGEYDQEARKAVISLETVLNMLRDCFRCYWFIEGNKLKIEHIKWFMNGHSYEQAESELDLNSLYNIPTMKGYSFDSNKLEYDKTNLAARYEFNWQDDQSFLFTGYPVDVKDKYLQADKTESIQIGQFSTDLFYMQARPNEFSSDGFALIGAIYTKVPVKPFYTNYTISIGEVYVTNDNGSIFSAEVQNNFLTWIELLDFYMFDMPGYTIESDIPGLEVKGIKKCMTQEIQFPSEEDVDPLKAIIVNNKKGQIEDIAINIDTRQVSIKLAFVPE